MYFMLNFSPSQLLLGYYFLLCPLLFWFRNTLFLCSEQLISAAWGAHAWVNPTMGSVGTAECPAGFVHWPESPARPSSSALLCIFKGVPQKLSPVWGSLALCPPIAWPGHSCHLHHCNDGILFQLCDIFLILGGFQTCIPPMAWAISPGFLTWT